MEKWEIDIPVDLVDDGVIATGDRRKAVNLRAFRCHGMKKCYLDKAMALRLRLREGYLYKFRVGNNSDSGPQRQTRKALCSTDKLKLLLASASGHELNPLLVSMYLLIPERQPTVNTPNRFELGINWSTDSILFPFISLSLANQ